jgi:hypothetical protein
MTHRLKRGTPERWKRVIESAPLVVARTVLTFYLVTIGFVIFRAGTWARAWAIVRELHHSSVPSTASYPTVYGLTMAVLALVFGHLLDYSVRRLGYFHRLPVVWWAVVVTSFAAAIALGQAGSTFIYFEF